MISVQTQLSSMIVDEPLVKFLLKIKQDFQIAINDFGYPVHPKRCSSSRCGSVAEGAEHPSLAH